MPSPAIPPVLTPDEWKQDVILRGDHRVYTPTDSSPILGLADAQGYAEIPIEHAPALISVVNSALPADSPYKITREDVEAIRDEACFIGSGGLDSRGSDDDDAPPRPYLTMAQREARLTTIAAKLAALLPPE